MVGIRRAIALLFLGFYVTQFGMMAGFGPDEFFPAYLGLALCYGLAFVALAAEWFWARWFAIGVGHFGSLLLLAMLTVGPEPILAFVGLTHLSVSLLLTGEGMAARYEYSEAASERWNFQEESLLLMRRAVMSAGSTIPILIIYALMPRPDALGVLALGLGIVGLFGLLRARTWGALSIGGAGMVVLYQLLVSYGPTIVAWGDPAMLEEFGFNLLALSVWLVPAALLRPMVRFIRMPG